MSKNARVCRKAETNKPAWLFQIKSKQNRTCRNWEGQKSTTHKTLCTTEVAIYCAGFEVSFLKSRVAYSMDLLLRHLLCRMVTKESIRRRSDCGGGGAWLMQIQYVMTTQWSLCRAAPDAWLPRFHSPTVQSDKRWEVGGQGLSDSRWRLAVVVGGLHLEDIGDDAVDLHVPDEAWEEQLLGDGGADQPESRETQQQLGQPDRQRKGCRVGGLKMCTDATAAI